jgi:hypothetical protein
MHCKNTNYKKKKEEEEEERKEKGEAFGKQETENTNATKEFQS